MAERTYSEREIAAILERAAKRQEAVDAARTGGGGLTLAELEQVAAAAGIAPEHVAAAAGEVEATAAPAARETVLGLQAEVTRSRVWPGPVSDEAWGEIVAVLRRTFRASGVVSEVGRVRSWASAASENEVPVHASLEPEGAGVRLTLTYRPGELIAVLTAIPVGLLALLGGIPLLTGTDAPLFFSAMIALAGALYAAVRLWYARSLRTTEAQFEAVLDRTEALLASASAPAAISDPAPLDPAPREAARGGLSLDALPDAPEVEAPVPAARRTRT